MITCAFYHSGIFVVAIGVVLWGGDVFVRKILMTLTYPREASITAVTDAIIELKVAKEHFDFNQGQYAYSAVSELSLFQWHPFNMSSSPHQREITFHIRKCGGWTKALYQALRITFPFF